MLTDYKDASRSDLIGWAHNHGVSELSVPRKIIAVDAIPLLGTGKTDYTRVDTLAREQLASTASDEASHRSAGGTS